MMIADICIKICGLIIFLFRITDAKLCLKNYDIGEREGNVYYCQDLVLTECCEIEREFTCCEPGKSKHLREQLQLWGAVLLFVLILMVLCIYYRRDSPACSSPTLSEACCSCMEKLSCTFKFFCRRRERKRMGDKQYHLKIDGSNAKAVDEYLEYHRIVGEDDGGTPFSPEEYEEYKQKILPMRMKNRLYTCLVSPTGMDCKLVGPETPCFCKHRYKQHKTDFESIPEERPIKLPCRAAKCKCASYHYVPLNGSQPIRCKCKHTADEHNEAEPFVCKKAGCTKCTGFMSPFTCGCGTAISKHTMIVETADEREARGHPLGEATPYAAMGGLTGFSSLAEGNMRLDPSGRGAPNRGFLEQSVTADDNPFLRANVHAIKAHQMEKNKQGLTGPDDEVFDDIAERVSSMRRPGEDDMEYYERRYQEKQKNRPAGVKREDLDTKRLQSGNRAAIEDKPKSNRTQPRK